MKILLVDTEVFELYVASQLVGAVAFVIYDSFAEYSLFKRALLQKRLNILRSLLVAATPYT